MDEIPFDAQHRFMATLNQVPYGQKVVLVKGAPERLREMCRMQMGGNGEVPLDPQYWIDRIAEAAAQGERILGFAMAIRSNVLSNGASIIAAGCVLGLKVRYHT